MTVEKFRSFAEARRALWLEPGDPLLEERLRRLAAMAAQPRPIRRGVERFRTLAEAKAYKGAAWQVRPDLLGD